MSREAWISLTVAVVVFAALQRRRSAPADVLFVMGLMVVTLLGVVSPEEAVAGFASPAVLMIGSLFVVAAALRSTGVLDQLALQVLGKAKGERDALARLGFPALGLSAFVNNTPVVAMLVPVAVDWCRRHAVSPSRLLIPVSYLAIMGGTCTLIGTSTNIVVHGLLKAEQNARLASGVAADERFIEALSGMGLFEIGMVGAPCAILGSVYLIFFGRRLLPNRTDLIEQLGDERREYLVEMSVQPQCPLIDRTVEAAGLRHLPGLFLIEIDRKGEVITPVTPNDVLRSGDRLIFTGIVSTIVDLEKIPGLVPAADMTYEVHPRKRHRRHLTEAVLSSTSPLIGTTVRAAKFRQLYNAAIVAVHRNGRRLTNKIGDVVLEAGDTLLLQTRTEFANAFRNSPDFFLVSRIEGSRARRHDRAWLSVALLAVLVAALTLTTWFGPQAGGRWASSTMPAVLALAIAGLMVVTRCVPPAEARAAIDVQVLVTIGAAVGLGQALTKSRAAHDLANLLVDAVGPQHPYLLLAALMAFTLFFTELITNTAVAALVFPLAVAVAEAAGGLSPRPFVMGIALAASSSFLTPVGYQTNLMVMGPGGYRPVDYLRAGFPLTIIVTVTALLLIPQVWPFAL